MKATAMCRKCWDVIQSKSNHDFTFCSCETIFVDGGSSCPRWGSRDPEDIFMIPDEELYDALTNMTSEERENWYEDNLQGQSSSSSVSGAPSS